MNSYINFVFVSINSCFIRWGKKDQNHLTGGRYMVFIAGGVGYSEIRVAYDQMQFSTKEIIVGGSHFISPTKFTDNVAKLVPGAKN